MRRENIIENVITERDQILIAKVLNHLRFHDTAQAKPSLERFRLDYESSKVFIRTTIYWLVRKDIVDDLVQETYLKAWKNYEKFDQKSSFKTWVYRIAKNVVNDHYRSHQNKELMLIDETQASSDENYEIKDLITKGLSLLSEKHREVFILYYKLELSKPEISELLSVSEGTVKSRIHYAKDEFVTFLSNNGVKS